MNGLVTTLILALFAIGMSLTTAITIKWAALARSALRASVVLFLLLMMTGMLLGAAIYFLSPSVQSLVIGLWVAAALMSLAVVIIFVQILREAQSTGTNSVSRSPAPLERVLAFQLVVIATVVVNELLMGWTFQRAAGGPVWLGDGGAGVALAALVVSPWFVLPMAFEMACALAWLRSEFPRPMVGLLAVQPVLMFASPPSIASPAWVIATAVLSSVAMAAALAVLLVDLYRGRPVSRHVYRYATALYVSIGLMAAGLAVWALYGSVGTYAVAVAGQMGIFLFAVTWPARFRADRAAEPGHPDGTEAAVGQGSGEPVTFPMSDGPRLRSP